MINRFQAGPASCYTPPHAQKKDCSGDLVKEHNPAEVEKDWYAWWESRQFFTPLGDGSKPPFVIATPPPNVTGSLHIGHALGVTIQDILCRWRRLTGYDVLWLPGTDHAGIATQNVVERNLKQTEGKKRQDYPREEFIKLIWDWVDKKGGEICRQMREMGSSYDWSREVFTLDEYRYRAVIEAFVRLYNKGLIFRGYKLINWCPTLQSVISDIEVDYKDLTPNELRKVPGYSDFVRLGYFTVFSYVLVGADPATDRSDERIYMATTRLETMLGDTAVAVNPNDPAYEPFFEDKEIEEEKEDGSKVKKIVRVGKKLWHPFRKEPIPIIKDEYVDPNYGTGAVKITPAHDPNDLAVGLRHNLRFINILNDDGTITNEVGGELFGGLPRYDAREKLKVELRKIGSIRDITPVSDEDKLPLNTINKEDDDKTKKDTIPRSSLALLRKRLQKSGLISLASLQGEKVIEQKKGQKGKEKEQQNEEKEKDKEDEKGDSSAAKKKKKFQAQAKEQGAAQQKKLESVQVDKDKQQTDQNISSIPSISEEDQLKLDSTTFSSDFGHQMSIAVCSRSGDIVEPMLKYQWFVNCSNEDGLAQGAKDAVRPVREKEKEKDKINTNTEQQSSYSTPIPPPSRKLRQTDGTILISPSQYKQTWDMWFDNMRDWCISRQLWWGHRIPAYRAYIVDDGDEQVNMKDGSVDEIDEKQILGDPKLLTKEENSTKWFVSSSIKDTLIQASQELKQPINKIRLVQDEDVLDTWFSSGLFPFSIMNWPGEIKGHKELSPGSDFIHYYPTSVMETGNDILFFWVARMVMMSLQV